MPPVISTGASLRRRRRHRDGDGVLAYQPGRDRTGCDGRRRRAIGLRTGECETDGSGLYGYAKPPDRRQHGFTDLSDLRDGPIEIGRGPCTIDFADDARFDPLLESGNPLVA